MYHGRNNLKVDLRQLLHESRYHRGSSVVTLRAVHHDVLALCQRLPHHRQGPLKVWIAVYSATHVHIHNFKRRTIAGVYNAFAMPQAIHYTSNVTMAIPPTLVNHVTFICQYEAASQISTDLVNDIELKYCGRLPLEFWHGAQHWLLAAVLRKGGGATWLGSTPQSPKDYMHAHTNLNLRLTSFGSLLSSFDTDLFFRRTRVRSLGKVR